MWPTALDKPMVNMPVHIHGSLIGCHTKGTASDTSPVATQLVLKNGNSYIAGSDPRKDGHAVAYLTDFLVSKR